MPMISTPDIFLSFIHSSIHNEELCAKHIAIYSKQEELETYNQSIIVECYEY